MRLKARFVMTTLSSTVMIVACGAGSLTQTPISASMKPAGSGWSCTEYSDSNLPKHRRSSCWRTEAECQEGMKRLAIQIALHDFAACRPSPQAFCHVRTLPSGEDEPVCSLSAEECNARSKGTALNPTIPSGQLPQPQYSRVTTCAAWD